MYRNSRLKHVKEIKDLCTEWKQLMHGRKVWINVKNHGDLILDQCNLLLETKKRKKSISTLVSACCKSPFSKNNGWATCDKCLGLCNVILVNKSKHSLPNEKEILGILDGLTIIVRK